jgi:transcriptional regulator with XRE-family HTH domain
MADDRSSFGKLLRKRREEAGLTQKAMAEKLKLAASYVSFVESGRKNPSRRMLQGLGRLFGSIDELREAAAVARAGKSFRGAVEQRFQREERIRELADRMLRALGKARKAWSDAKNRQTAEVEWQQSAFQMLERAALISPQQYAQIVDHLELFIEKHGKWSYNPLIPTNAFELFWQEANDPSTELGRLDKFASVLEAAAAGAGQRVPARAARPAAATALMAVPVLMQKDVHRISGKPSKPEPQLIAYQILIPARAAWRPAAFAVELEDDAMAPDYLQGSIVLFEPVKEGEFQGLLLVVTADAAAFREVIRAAKGSYRLRPANPVFAEQIIGRRAVRWAGRPVGALTEVKRRVRWGIVLPREPVSDPTQPGVAEAGVAAKWRQVHRADRARVAPGDAGTLR